MGGHSAAACWVWSRAKSPNRHRTQFIIRSTVAGLSANFTTPDPIGVHAARDNPWKLIDTGDPQQVVFCSERASGAGHGGHG